MSQVVLLNVYDVMIKAVMVVPRVETKLYSEWVSFQQVHLLLVMSRLQITNNSINNINMSIFFFFQSGTKKTLKPVVSDEIVNEAKAKVCEF